VPEEKIPTPANIGLQSRYPRLAGGTGHAWVPGYLLVCLLFLTSIMFAASCGKDMEARPILVPGGQTEAEAYTLLNSDPGGPIRKPSVPSNLRDLALGTERDRRGKTERIDYVLEVNSPDLPEAADIFLKTAELSTMKDKPIFSPFLLATRLRNGQKTGQDILNSLGYYDGTCEGRLEKTDSDPGNKVVVTFTPGTRYLVGETRVAVDPSAGPPPAHGYPPLTLANAGLKTGDPAVAASVVAAVERIPDLWGNLGYPFAALSGTRYVLDKDKKVLDVEATIVPGEFTRMGRLVIVGDSPVREEFIQNSVNWRHGEPWNQDLIERFQDALFQRGIFKPLTVERGSVEHPDGTRDIVLRVEAAPLRTVSGSLNYDSDFGPGIDLAWEHRNLTRWGDKFRVEMPVWQDLQQLGVQYTRPYFFSKRQNFLASISFLNERADAYNLQSMSASAGVERQLSRHLTGTLLATLERGTLDEFVDSKEGYQIIGFPVTLDWNWANDLLDPTTGSRLKVLVSPYNGHYTSDFNVLKTRVDANQYFSLREDGFLVAAFRVSLGAITGDEARYLPTSMRFFSGGGGSVRGYRYQSIGPLNNKGKPAGGGFITEASGELRWRFSDTMGVTLFVDGGQLYEEVEPSYLGKDLLWGGGLGFRYYTPFGPFRVDVASPLTPRDSDPDLQLYISLGQSF
jgi:translocation and assembly module TamA